MVLWRCAAKIDRSMVWKRQSRWVSFASGRAGRHIFASTRLRLLGSEAARENIGGKVAAGRVGGDAVRHPLGRQGREVAEVGMCRHDGAGTGGGWGGRAGGGGGGHGGGGGVA